MHVVEVSQWWIRSDTGAVLQRGCMDGYGYDVQGASMPSYLTTGRRYITGAP